MQNIFDSHAHYDDPRFDEDRDTLLSSMASHGVRAIMNVGNTTHANLAGIELAKKYPFVYCSIGIHPDQSEEIAAQNSREYLDAIAQQLSYEKAMALGEIGLDYYYDDDAPRDILGGFLHLDLALHLNGQTEQAGHRVHRTIQGNEFLLGGRIGLVLVDGTGFGSFSQLISTRADD